LLRCIIQEHLPTNLPQQVKSWIGTFNTRKLPTYLHAVFILIFNQMIQDFWDMVKDTYKKKLLATRAPYYIYATIERQKEELSA
jgi:hypothetical protein